MTQLCKKHWVAPSLSFCVGQERSLRVEQTREEGAELLEGQRTRWIVGEKIGKSAKACSPLPLQRKRLCHD
jgi:hypothetical protein